MKPTPSRPHMPGYGLLPPADGADLLPWSWAQQRLESSHAYWLATTRSGARPHVMPVWGIWIDDSFVFSTGRHSVKAGNLRANPWCALTTQDAAEAVVVEGRATMATMVDDDQTAQRVGEAYAAKYGDPPPDPIEGPLFVLVPVRVFGFIERAELFASSATRWVFPETGRT